MEVHRCDTTTTIEFISLVDGLFGPALDDIEIYPLTGAGSQYVVTLASRQSVEGLDFANRQIDGQANTSPVITNPAVELALASNLFRYDASASDAENDPITFSLRWRRDGMTVHPKLGSVVWVPGLIKWELTTSCCRSRTIVVVWASSRLP